MTLEHGTAIELNAVVKTFGHVRALDGLDLEVAHGEVHGFLGPNGAGKSTTMRVLLGLLRPDSGTATLLDGDPWGQAAELHRRIAYVPGDVNLWPNLTGGEVIDMLSRMRGGLDEKRRAELLERFELDPSKKARTYSKGNRQKVALVAALATDAELLLLDEPTSGLDPLLEAEFQRCIREVKAEGTTVLLSSHILAEVEALCDRVSIIRSGVNVQSGTLQELRQLTRTSVVAETVRPATALDTMSGVHGIEHADDETHHRAAFDVDTDQLDDAIKVLGEAGIRSLTAHPPTLEELFLQAVRREGRGLVSAPYCALTGTHHLVRLILRRDRIRLPLWILGITALTAVSAQSVLALYDTPAKRAGYAVTVDSSGAGKMMNGIPYDVNTLGGITSYETTSTATLLVALMVMFLVVRHTRAEEESGRAELLRATVTGRHAATAAVGARGAGRLRGGRPARHVGVPRATASTRRPP